MTEAVELSKPTLTVNDAVHAWGQGCLVAVNETRIDQLGVFSTLTVPATRIQVILAEAPGEPINLDSYDLRGIRGLTLVKAGADFPAVYTVESLQARMRVLGHTVSDDAVKAGIAFQSASFSPDDIWTMVGIGLGYMAPTMLLYSSSGISAMRLSQRGAFLNRFNPNAWMPDRYMNRFHRKMEALIIKFIAEYDTLPIDVAKREAAISTFVDRKNELLRGICRRFNIEFFTNSDATSPELH